MKALDNRFYVKFMQLEIGLLIENIIFAETSQLKKRHRPMIQKPTNKKGCDVFVVKFQEKLYS